MVRITRIAAAVAMFAVAMPAVTDAESLSDRVDRLAGSVDDLEGKVQSTLVSGGSSPVSFSGEARLKVQYHDLGYDAPGYMLADRSYIQSGWEGNDNLFRLGMVARAGRNTVLWAKLGFQHTLVGYHDYSETGTSNGPNDDGFLPYQYRNDKVGNSITIHEDMCAGIAVRTVPASFWVKLGNTLWTEASPLTVWKAQPRTFAWEYLPFEVEQPIARYYEYNIAKGEKSGRAAWNKKPFNGINVESINLPADIYANFVYGTFERYDNFEREYVDFGGDLGYADGAEGPFPAKGHGMGDSYRHVIHARLAKAKMFGDMIWGLNYVGINYTDDILYVSNDNAWVARNSSNYERKYPLIVEFGGKDSIFVKEPKIISTDIKGSISDKFTIHADVALSKVDTVWFYDTSSTRTDRDRLGYRTSGDAVDAEISGGISGSHPEYYNNKGVVGGGFVPAFYTKLGYNNGFLPVEADIAYISKGFYSPFSFAVPQDAFFAYGSNMVGAGKFIARGEGSPYAQNMAGLNLTFTPKLSGYGHLRLKYGQHFNIEEGRDILFFPYRLNGADMFSFFHSSYNRWGNGIVDNSVKTRGRNYKGRLGDESFAHASSYSTNNDWRAVAGPGAGGLRSDFLAMMEGFVPYKSAADAYNNWHLNTFRPGVSYGYYEITRDSASSTILNQSFSGGYKAVYGDPSKPDSATEFVWDTTLSTSSSWVPENKKYTFNLELDAAYDIGAFLGYKRDLFVGGYVGLHGISSSVKPLAFSDDAKEMLMWSMYVRLEPAIALHKSFYLLGLFGYENWRARDAWMIRVKSTNTNDGRIVNPTTLTYINTAGNKAELTASGVKPDNFVNVPINYVDMAYGLGFDWDMLERVGLHGRVKYVTHEDKGLNEYYEKVNQAQREENKSRPADGQRPVTDFTAQDKNDWGTWVFSLEIKTWF
jgi:hypothetical protein